MSLDLFWSSISQGLGSAASVIALRTFPGVVALSATPDSRPLDRVTATAGYLGIAYVASRYGTFEAPAVLRAYAYLLPALVVPLLLARLWRCRTALFALSFALFLVLPALVESTAKLTTLLLGWGVALSVYSFCVDSANKGVGTKDYVFFVLVNPVAAYPNRGRRVGRPRLSKSGLLRISRGAASLTASVVLQALISVAVFGSTLGFLATSALRLIQIYFAHTGLAHVQIGMMNQLGYEVPECYPHPLLATSPKQFWSRWNTYIGSWVRLYVFQPLLLHMRRRKGRSSRLAVRSALRGVAVVVSFACIGLLHDVYKDRKSVV